MLVDFMMEELVLDYFPGDFLGSKGERAIGKSSEVFLKLSRCITCDGETDFLFADTPPNPRLFLTVSMSILLEGSLATISCTVSLTESMLLEFSSKRASMLYCLPCLIKAKMSPSE